MAAPSTPPLAAVLCDSSIHRFITDGASVVVDAGRGVRTVNHHLFGVLAIRDRGCRFPGCDRAVSQCEAHHVTPWQHGGSTDRDNTVLLCWRHHHDFAHHPQWRLKLLPDATVEVTTPDGRTLTSRPTPPTPTLVGAGRASDRSGATRRLLHRCNDGPGRASGDGSIQRDRHHTPTAGSSVKPLPDPQQA